MSLERNVGGTKMHQITNGERQQRVSSASIPEKKSWIDGVEKMVLCNFCSALGVRAEARAL